MVSLFSGLWSALFPHNHSQWKHFWKAKNESRCVASMIMKWHRDWEKASWSASASKGWTAQQKNSCDDRKKKAGQILRAGKKWSKSNKESSTRNITWKSQLRETRGPLAGLSWAQPCLLVLPSLPGHLSCACPPCHLPSTECERKGLVILLLRQRNYRARDVWLT